MSEEKIYLNCPFDEKDECKSLGGKWDGEEKKWFITDSMDSEPFSQWLQDSGPSILKNKSLSTSLLFFNQGTFCWTRKKWHTTWQSSQNLHFN